MRRPEWALVIHGGAGAIERSTLTAELEALYRAALATVLEAGSKVLGDGGLALDAFESAIQLTAYDPLFNAGRGAVFDAQEHIELDAAIMDGGGLKRCRRQSEPNVTSNFACTSGDEEIAPRHAGWRWGSFFCPQHGLEQVLPSFFAASGDTRNRSAGVNRRPRYPVQPPHAASGPRRGATLPTNQPLSLCPTVWVIQ